MKKKHAAALAATVALVATGGMVDTATAALPCVSKTEFAHVSQFMKKARVHAIFDTAGRQESTYVIGDTTYETRTYRACTKTPDNYTYVSVDYKSGREEGKYAYWG